MRTHIQNTREAGRIKNKRQASFPKKLSNPKTTKIQSRNTKSKTKYQPRGAKYSSGENKRKKKQQKHDMGTGSEETQDELTKTSGCMSY